MAVVSVRKVDPVTTLYPCATFDCDGRASFVEMTANPTAFYGVCDGCAERMAMARLAERGYCEACSVKKLRMPRGMKTLAAALLARQSRRQIEEIVTLLQAGLEEASCGD